MLRLFLFVVLLTRSIRTAHVTDTPSVFDRIYQKLDKLTPTSRELSPNEKLYEKLNRLNSLSSENDRLEFSDEDDLISEMQTWLSPEQIGRVVKVIQDLKTEGQESDQDYSEGYWNDEDSEQGEEEYAMDGNEELDELSDASSVSKTSIMGITPSAITKLGSVTTVVSAAESLAYTNARPMIIEDRKMSQSERSQLSKAVLRNTNTLIRNSRCLVPQPRWLTVRQLAPAANTQYTPPCVQLHRCAPDSGCCTREGEVCAPIDGKYVQFPFLLHKADNSMPIVKMQFYNHTQCACVSREKLQTTIASRRILGSGIGNPGYSDTQEDTTPRREMDRQNDWRPLTEEPTSYKDSDEETTAPPQLRRCTCPGLFFANNTENIPCSCVCEWPDLAKRRECQSLARGKEHFGLRDRVCVERGDCSPPTCEFGAYDRTTGRCPQRKYRRGRIYHTIPYHRGRY